MKNALNPFIEFIIDVDITSFHSFWQTDWPRSGDRWIKSHLWYSDILSHRNDFHFISVSVTKIIECSECCLICHLNCRNFSTSQNGNQASSKINKCSAKSIVQYTKAEAYHSYHFFRRLNRYTIIIIIGDDHYSILRHNDVNWEPCLHLFHREACIGSISSFIKTRWRSLGWRCCWSATQQQIKRQLR